MLVKFEVQVYVQPILLVPQGREFQAVQQGLRRAQSRAEVIAIPMGMRPVAQFLQAWWPRVRTRNVRIWVMGLCGSLTPRLEVGTAVQYDTCTTVERTLWQCAPFSLASLDLPRVRAFSSDRPIWSVQEKRQLATTYGTDVVDMEATAILQFFADPSIPVTMVRVVSDDIQYDLPDLSAAIDAAGQLRSFPLAWAMVRQPIGSLRLVQGALQGLSTLTTVGEQWAVHWAGH